MSSLEQWKGKVAVVTGASSGIGAAIARKLVENGLQVVGFARRLEKVEELSYQLRNAPGRLTAVSVDMLNELEIVEAFKWVTENVGPVAILINNAGLVYCDSLSEGQTDNWRQTLELNVLATCVATREALRIMKSVGVDGQIINIASVSGHVIPNIQNLNIYPASKHALIALTESLRQELLIEGSKIKISILSPGVVTTPFLETGGFPAVEFPVALSADDVADAAVYILGTPPHVQIQEVIIRPVGEAF